RVSRVPNAATKASTGNCETGDQRCLPQKAGCRKAGAVASPGRQITATNTDSKNSIAKAGRIAGNDKPRSRLKEKAMKFSGSRTSARRRSTPPGTSSDFSVLLLQISTPEKPLFLSAAMACGNYLWRRDLGVSGGRDTGRDTATGAIGPVRVCT